MNYLVIFAATVGYIRFFIWSVTIGIVFLVSWIVVYTYFDSEEVRLRNRLTAQEQIVEIDPSVPERKKLIEYRSEYDAFRQTWYSRLLLQGRD